MPSQGQLAARAITSDAMIPVEEATVTVTQKAPNGLEELLALWITNESGETPVLSIPTPEPALSQEPSEERPFATVDITAEHPLYERIVVKDAQVFPDTVSMQILRFIPLDQAPEVWNPTEEFDIPPQNL